MKKIKAKVISIIVLACAVGNAWAIPVICHDTSKNYMTLDSSVASSCLDSGAGNINGSNTDLFANSTDWLFIEKSEGGAETALFDLSYTAGVGDNTSITGTWSIGSSFWSQYDSAALAFKFGTGNTVDEWFVFDLSGGITSGSWTFFSVLAPGSGGLSHSNLYARDIITLVSEPGSLALICIGIAGIGITRRKKEMA